MNCATCPDCGVELGELEGAADCLSQHCDRCWFAAHPCGVVAHSNTSQTEGYCFRFGNLTDEQLELRPADPRFFNGPRDWRRALAAELGLGGRS